MGERGKEQERNRNMNRIKLEMEVKQEPWQSEVRNSTGSSWRWRSNRNLGRAR